MTALLFFLACGGAYVGAFVTRARHRMPVLLLASALVAVLLLVLGAPYEEAFKRGIAPYSYLLGPMTVALAVPLADSESGERGKLGLLGLVLAGSTMVSALGIVLLARKLGASEVACASLAPRAATSALSVPTSEALAGSASLTSVVVAISGVVVGLVGPRILTILHVTHPTARGLALGASGHLVATARAWEEGREAGTASTFALIVHGVFTVGASFLLHALRFF